MTKKKYFREDEVHWDIIFAAIAFVLILFVIFAVCGIISEFVWYGHLRTQ